MSKLLICLFNLLLLVSCIGTKRQYLSNITIPQSRQVGEQAKARNSCRDKLAFVPDTSNLELMPMKYIRINFHVMRRGDGSGNFSKEEGREQILKVLDKANHMLANNKKMKLPEGNSTPVLPTRLRYVLSADPNIPGDEGIYFHDDEELYYLIAKGEHTNNYNRDVYKKYGVRKDSVLNVFVMAYHADSLQSNTFKPRVRGIGFGNWCKVTTWYHQVRPETQRECVAKFSKFDIHYAHTNLNHEIGHVLGLRHAWTRNDGCDDTPMHNNCWSQTGQAPCDGPSSNNIMDYNSAPQAWTPCQIATIHFNLSRKNRPSRKLTIKDWCDFDESQSVVISGSQIWKGAKDIAGNITIERGASLTIQCRVSLAKGAKIIVKPGSKLVLDGANLENDCGESWLGIEKWQKGAEEGEVICSSTASIKNALHPVEVKHENI